MPSPRDGYISLDDFTSLILNKYPAGSFDAWERDDILRYILQKNPSFTDYLNDQDLKFLFPQLKSEGEKLYETIGSDAAQGFWGRVGSGVAEGAKNVASAGMDILGDEGKTRRYFREQAQERLKDNVELQALYAWHEDEPTTFKNVADVWNTDVFSRALSEGLPSILTMWGGSSAANLITRGARGAFGKTMAGAAATKAARQAAKLSSYGIMAALEGSSNYVNSMNILTDQGYSEEEAREYAALPALGYSMVAGWLETTPWMYFVNRFSPAGVENRLLQSLTMGFMNKGVTKSNAPGIFGKQWGVAKATSILDQALLEGATEWSQAELDMMITNVMKNPNVPAKTPDQVAKYMYEDFLNAFSSWEAAGEQFWSDEIREQAIAGMVTGGTFGSSPMGRSWASIGLTEEERKEAAAEGVDAEVIEEGEVHVEGAPVGDVEVVEEGDLSAKDFLTSLVTGSPITVSPSEVKSDETQPVMTAVSQAKKGRTFEEQVVDYARNRGADFIDDLDAMEDGDKRRLLNNVGKWMQDKNILDKGGVNVDDVATLLDMHSTGKITIEEQTVRGEKGEVLSTKSILNISEDATEREQQEVVGIARRSIQSDTKGRRRKRPEDEVQGRLESLNIDNLRVAREQERVEEKRSREERKERPKKERKQRPQPQRERQRPQPERPRPSTKERIKQKKEGDKIKEKVVVGQSANVKSGKLSQHHELAGAAVTILDKMKGVAKVAGIATRGKKKGKRIERLIPYHELEGLGEVSPKGEGARVQITFGANKGKLGTILTIDSKNKTAKIRTDDGKTSVLSFKKKGSKFVAAEQVDEQVAEEEITAPFPTELGTPNVGKVRRLQKARGEQSKLKKGFKWIGISSRTKEGPVSLRVQGKDVTNLVESAPPGTSWVLHKTPGEKGWSVTNEQSGLAVGQNSRTQKEAINRANEILNKGMRDKPGGVGIFQETMRGEEVSKFREDVGLKPLPKAPAKPKKEAAPKKKKKKEGKKAPSEQMTDLPTLYNMLKSDNPAMVKVAKEQLEKMGEELPGERVSRRERKKKSGRGKKIPLDAHDKKVAERKKKLKQWLPTASDIRSIPRKLGQLQSSPAFRKKIIARLKKRMPFVRNMSAKQLDKLLKESPNSLGFALGEMVGIPDGAPIESYPHEYFHIYWSMIQDTPFVKKAVNLFKKDAYASFGNTPVIDIFKDAGTMTQEELDTAVVEEYLARQVANVYITMASESLPAKAARWIKRFYRKLKNMFRTTKFNKNDVIDIFAEELYGTDPLYSVPQSAQGKLKRWAASINNEQGEGFDESVTEDPEDEQDETLGEDASPADFVFKRFEESTQKLFGAPLLNSEVATLIHKARELEVDVGSIKGMKQFLAYIRAAGFAQNTNRKVMFLADFEGKQKKKKTLNRKERNAFIRFYNHANDTIRRSTKVFLQSVDGDIQLKSSETDFMGNTESEFINKSFIDDLDVGEDTVMMLGSDVFAETRYSKWKNFEDPQYGPDFLNFEDVEFLEDQLSYFENEKGSPRPMALLGIKGADKNAFMIVRIGNQFRYKNGALWKDKKIVEYFRDEIAAGRMTEQHLKDIEESALTRAEENDFVLLQAAARHNWWKSVMGNNYLMEDDMQTKGVKDYFNRTRIPFNEGSTPRGLGDTRVMVMDMDTIEIEYEDANGNVVRRDPKEDYTETGEPRYFGDGFLGVNDRILSGVEESTGRKPEANEYPLSEFKPSFYHITEDKESVLAIKANASKPPPGLRFLDKATGRLVMETREDENGQMHFYDGNGVEFDMFATKDEAKRNTGQFDVTNEVFDYNFPETSMKVIFGSSPKGKPSAAHPLSWYEMFIAPDLMKDPDVAKALELAGFHILNVMQENIITLIKGRWNPSFLKRNLKRMGILDSYGSLKEGKIINRIKAGALRHSVFLGRYRSSLGNMLIKKTAFKGRRTGQGTLFTIYPDWKNEVAEDEIIVGDMNEVTIKRVADKVIGKKDRSASKKERGIREEWDALYKNKETRDDAVNQLNAVLAVEDIKTLVHRQPIPDVGSPRILRIKEIRIGLGNVAIPNSKVLYNIMQGDNDGDHLALEFLPDKLTNALEKAVNSKAFKNRKKSIKLGIFKHDTHTGNLANFDDIKKFTSMVSVGQFAQGISVNAKNIRELLSYKDIVVGLTDKGKTAHLENAKLAFLPSNSNVIMDYAPLDIDVLTADGGIVMKQLMENDKVKIITSDGKFIKTPEELLKFAGRETSMPSRISSAKAPQAIAKFFTPIRDSIKGKMTVSAYMKTLGPRTLTGKVEFLRNENNPNEFLLLETTSEGTRAFGYVSDKKASLTGRQDRYGFKLNNIYQQGEVYGLVGKEYIEKNYGLTWEGTIGGDERPFVTSVTEETGENEVYLYTTSAHEMATILQASVDNAKELLLYGWGWGNEDLYGKSGYNFLFSRMIVDKRDIRKMRDGSWKDVDSPKGAPSVTKSLLKEEGALTMMRHVFNFFNYSQFRQGRDKNRRSLGLQEIGRRSFDKANFIASTPEEKGARVKRHMFTSDKRLKKLVKSVTMNNRFTSLEQGFAKYFKLAREQIKNHGEEGEVLNWDVTRYNHTRLKNAFIFARDSINANFAHLVDKYKVPIAEGDLEAAKKFARLMHTRFYNIGKDKMYIAEDGTEYDATEDRVVRNEYSKMMGAFIEDHIHQFLALSPGAQFLHTHMFLNALERSDVRINRRGGVSTMITDAADKLLPWELMDEDLSIEYLDAWSDGLDASSNTEERVAQEKWKDTRVDIAQDKYEIDNGCRVASK
jgi:hypothetical protein